MRLWIDDLRPAPEGYVWVKNVFTAKRYCYLYLFEGDDGRPHMTIEELHLDHDSGEQSIMGGDYIKLLEWLEEKTYTEDWVIDSVFKIHSQNVVGRQNMEAIIKHNNWRLEL